MIAVCLILAIIPFLNYYSLFFRPEYPVFIDQRDNSLVIEIVANNQQEGIYFVGPEISFGQLLKDAGFDTMFSYPDFKLSNGMKININSASENNNINVTKMGAAERLALGMAVDINQVTQEELLLIKGIGETTAEEILNLRKKLGRFTSIDQLMELKGIKERKLAQIRKYLNIEKKQLINSSRLTGKAPLS